jgi:hypothetical protein
MATTVLDTTAPETGRGSEADQAIARVLGAERDARVAVAECAQQAERELQAGRERARLIAARAAERVARVQRAVGQQRSQALDRIGAERAALAQQATAGDDEAQRRARAVAQLARELAEQAAPHAPAPRAPSAT